MKVVVFNGSPAAAQSHTNVISEAFLSGAQRTGAQTENIFLIEKDIAYCRGCFFCWHNTPGECVHKDDMHILLEKYLHADIVCFASPVFSWNTTPVLMNFIDRLIPLKSPAIVAHGEDFDLEDAIPKTQKFVVISNCGFPGNNNFKTVKMVCKTCNPILEIYRNSGLLLKSKDEAIKETVNIYLQEVAQSGYELVVNGQVSSHTKQQLEMELMSIEDYIKYIAM